MDGPLICKKEKGKRRTDARGALIGGHRRMEKTLS
jgi:hypothetical protein